MTQKGIIYLICENVEYGSAITNRLLAYSRGFQNQGFYSEIIALRGYYPKDYQPEEGYVMRGCFASRCRYKLFRFLLSYVYVIFFVLFKLRRDDAVILYGCLNYIQLFFLNGKGRIFQERTENPEVVTSRIMSLDKYLKLCNKLTGMFVISRPLKRYFTNAGVDANKIHIINMIVDATRFKNIKKDESRGKYIAYCGNIWDDSKDGISELLQSFSKYHHHFPDRKLFIAGPVKSQKQKQAYEEFANGNGIRDAVIFMGLVSPYDMPALLVNAEMLLLTRPNNKQAEYGFPTKLGEYLLTERPVLVSRVGDIDAFLIDGENALLADPENIDEIVSKMIWISRNPEAANHIGEKGAECALTNFNNNTESRKILAAIGFVASNLCDSNN